MSNTHSSETFNRFNWRSVSYDLVQPRFTSVQLGLQHDSRGANARHDDPNTFLLLLASPQQLSAVISLQNVYNINEY